MKRNCSIHNSARSNKYRRGAHRSAVAGAFWMFALAGSALQPAMAASDAVTANASTPTQWPALTRPAENAPSVLLIMTDDVGFGASSTFGGPIGTPTFDGLARSGLRFNNMTTTGICSPTRAALLTGRNHNVVNMGSVTNVPTGFDGYTTVIPKSAATGARLLQDDGYSTAMFGKAHITPSWETGPSGPFDRWPTGLGFQYFYGFIAGDANQWAPSLYENTMPIEPAENKPGYFLERDMADKAIGWMRTQQGANPGKPFFVYYAPGTAHAPHHAPPEWIAKYKGQFDKGWDAVREQTLARQKALGVVPRNTKLSARPSSIPAWNSLTEQQKRAYARQMEAYAGALAFADHEIGRVIDEAKRNSNGNLMVVYVQGDNGSSAEGGPNGSLNEHAMFAGATEDLATIDARRDEIGGPTTLPLFSNGWAFAMNAPFPWFKQLASHYGATRNGVVVSWDGHIKNAGGVRSQFHHITDIMPTILEAAQVKSPKAVDGVEQLPFDGVSMTYSFNNARAPSTRHTQYYALWDNMAVYHDGWVAASMPEVMPWKRGAELGVPPHVDGRKWELFDVKKDFSESTDLASRYPDKLRSMQDLFFAEAKRNQALPIHRLEGAAGRPDYNAGRTDFRFTGPVSRLPEEVAPHLAGRSFDLTAKVRVQSGATDGAVLAVGGRFGGITLHVLNGRPTFEYNFADQQRTTIAGTSALAPGDHVIGLRFDRAMGPPVAPANVTLMVDGEPVASGAIEKTIGAFFSIDEGFDVGSDTGTPVSKSYSSPNAFSGELEQLDIHLRSGEGG